MPARSTSTASTTPPAKPAATAAPIANGLVYVNPDMPGIRRLKHGDKFRYRDAAGRWVRDPDELSRIRMLAIPPAYTDVWICPLPNGHLQATGIDARGRKQYRYHPDWRLFKDETKFERLEAFALALPRIRARVARDLQEGAANKVPGRQQVLAALVRLLDTTLLRVGNEEYASSNGSFGLTTLRNRHAAVQGAALKLRFRGKSGVMHEAKLDDPRVAKVVRQCQQLPGQALFQYQDEEDGELRSVSSTDVNDYLAEASPGERFTAKDFRTWHGTVQALELTRLACEPGRTAADGSRYTAKEILATVARQLGNTPAVCKKAYVHPAVLALGSALAGDADDPSAEVLRKMSARTAAAGRTRGLHAPEQRLLAFLRLHRRKLARELREARGPARRKKAQPAASAKQTLSRSSATV
ncbi:DNA topoisomerase-1 [Variovorax sp. TBS-050B]|uniref:DNA topoisomerase IB n=1 Tax=Variovorax sp. TBS-050B TaxID=2940551 RepID=UPI0024749152|nr:DNA topoisomerase IB [Variovorax sp. TBS-050B]MDH6593219.1 DNA topoisomerase-1 [Variovorax sp. TBS-050B]